MATVIASPAFSFADFLKENNEKIHKATPVNPPLEKDDVWRKETCWDDLYREKK